MKTSYKGIFLVLILQSNTVLSEENQSKGFFLDLGIDNGETAPEFFVPIRWSGNSYSGFGYRTSDTRIEESNSLPASLYTSNENNYFISENRLRINVFTYESIKSGSTISYGVDYESVDRVEEEFGYLEPALQPYISFKNVNNFEIKKLSFKLAYESTLGSWMNYKLGYVYSPNPEIKYTHDIYYITASFDEADHTNSYSQDASQQINLDFEFKVSSLLDISLNIDYELLPISFEYNNFNGTSFDLTKLSYENKTNRISLKLIFKKPLFANVRPTIGFKNEKVYKDSDKISDDDFITIGIENRF